MLLRDRIREQGNLLFRWRGLVPLLLAPAWLLAVRHHEWIELRFGDFIDDLFDCACVAISVTGLALRVATVGHVPRRSSGRNTRKGQVADTLNTTGFYSIVRNPLYLANGLILTGFLLATGSLWLVAVGLLGCCLHYERVIFAEEAFLVERFGDRYREWAEKTPAFFPRLSLWTPPARPFCWRTALLREYQTTFALVVAFAVKDYLEDWLAHNRIDLELDSTIAVAIAFAAFLVVRTLRKKTRLLKVPIA